MNNKCLIIGLGQIGMGYDLGLDISNYVLSHARGFYLHPNFDLVGGVDSDVRKCNRFKEVYNLPAYSDITEALEALSPNIIVIATPSDSHLLILDLILQVCNPQVIICEKPLHNSLEEAIKILEICDSRQIKLFVNYIRRSDKGAIKVKAMFEEGIIKQPIKCTAWYSKGLINNGSHLINLLEFWLGDIVDYKVIRNQRLWNGEDPELDLEINFQKGTAILLSCWEEYYPHFSIEMLSPSGILNYMFGGNKITWMPSNASLENPKKDFLNERCIEIDNDLNSYQLNFINNLSLAIEGKDCNISRGEDALRTLRNIFKIIKGDKI